MDVGWQSVFCTTETDIFYQSVRPKKPVCPRETSSTIGAFIQATRPMFPSPGLQTQKKNPMILLDVFSNKKMLDVVFWCVCIYAYIYICNGLLWFNYFVARQMCWCSLWRFSSFCAPLWGAKLDKTAILAMSKGSLENMSTRVWYLHISMYVVYMIL